MKVTAIINPVSGAGLDTAGLNALFRNARAAGIHIHPVTTRYPGHAGRLLRHLKHESDAVIAVGGDGTVREVAESLAHSRVPMLIWPQGTENLVAKSLGFRADPERTLRTLLAGPVHHLDLGEANHRMFMVVAGVGFDAEVVQRLTRNRTGHITHLSYAAPLWRTFWEHRWPLLTVTAQTPQGPVRWEGRGMVFIGNMSRYALALPVVPQAIPDDGLLDLVVLPCRGRLAMLGHALRTIRRKHLEYRDVLTCRFTSLQVDSNQPVPVQIDGEQAGCVPLEITLQPGALAVKVPPTDDDG